MLGGLENRVSEASDKKIFEEGQPTKLQKNNVEDSRKKIDSCAKFSTEFALKRGVREN